MIAMIIMMITTTMTTTKHHVHEEKIESDICNKTKEFHNIVYMMRALVIIFFVLIFVTLTMVYTGYHTYHKVGSP
jgi:hypothetical protein